MAATAALDASPGNELAPVLLHRMVVRVALELLSSFGVACWTNHAQVSWSAHIFLKSDRFLRQLLRKKKTARQPTNKVSHQVAYLQDKLLLNSVILVDGGWSKWGAWGRCTGKCKSGVQVRKRTCTRPPPANGGKKCRGRRMENKSCPLTPCPGKLQYYKQNRADRRMIACFLFSTHGPVTEINLTILLSNRIRSANRISVEQLSAPLPSKKRRRGPDPGWSE